MKKITFLIASLGGGGAERVTALLANKFAQKGYDVQLIIFSSMYDEYEIDHRVKKAFLPTNKNKIKDIVYKIRELKKLLRDFSPEYVIELGFSYRYLFFGNLLNKYKFILSERNAPQFHHSNKIEWKMIQYCFNKAYRVVFQTQDAQKSYKKNIQNISTVIPNPIKDNLPDPFYGDRDNRIVAFSRLNEQKNIPMMLRVFKQFIVNNKDFVLEIYGRGESEQELKQYAIELGISNQVTFKGFEKDIHNKIKSAMMFISTSDYEGISNSMLEALAIGLPCVCTDCPAGGARMAIRSGHNGYLVPVRDEQSMVEIMNHVVNNQEEMKLVSKQATEIKIKLSIDEIFSQWEIVMK
ncbi:glycosyltransferase [Priestia megaterium]|uniref:glycosyltransferase n=1 Tax=Priestia megaterium TaxID=1404 RepID=UPI003FD09903